MKDGDPRSSPKFPWMTWAIIGFVAVTAYVLLTEHPAHFASFLPFALLLACPLMHLFHHGRHNHSPGNDRDNTHVEGGGTNGSSDQHRLA